MLYYKHDSSGEIKAEYAYNAWGEIISSTGTMAEVNPIRYRGYYYDAETGFYYCKSRYYDPEICRFISPDSSYSTGQDFAGNNAFAYCGNNPVSRSDDEGEFWHIAVGAIVGAAVNVFASYTASKLTGEEYTFTDGLMDAVSGAISGGFAASGFGRVGQIVANAAISMANNAAGQIIKNKGLDNFNLVDMLQDGLIGGFSGAIGGKGMGKYVNYKNLNNNLTKKVFSGGVNVAKKGISYYASQTAFGYKKYLFASLKKSGAVSFAGQVALNILPARR